MLMAKGTVDNGERVSPVRQLLHRLSNPRVLALVVLPAALVAIIVLLGDILAPVIAALVLAYVLQGPVTTLERIGMRHLAAVLVVFTAFVAFLILALLAVIPLLFQQLLALAQQLPVMAGEVQRSLLALPQKYPKLVSETQIVAFINMLQAEAFNWGQVLLTRSLASFVFVATTAVYLVLVPFLVLFMLKDQRRIAAWFAQFVPRDSQLLGEIWEDVDRQLGNYIRGKVWEMLVVGMVSYAAFALLDINYPALLAAVSGLSLLVPYIGMVAAAIPLGAVAYFQWGLHSESLYAVICYTLIHVVDGNVLAPVLLSGTTNLHPIAIAVAILVFGGIWGVWGLFFAVPLATVLQAVLRAISMRSRDDIA
jgi:putative permease